jgi:hypothetical protein
MFIKDRLHDHALNKMWKEEYRQRKLQRDKPICPHFFSNDPEGKDFCKKCGLGNASDGIVCLGLSSKEFK